MYRKKLRTVSQSVTSYTNSLDNMFVVTAFGRRKRTTNCIFDALRDFEAESSECNGNVHVQNYILLPLSLNHVH